MAIHPFLKHIFVVRHGLYSSDYPEKLIGGGRLQAQELGELIKNFHYSKKWITRVISSSLRRCIETAEIIADVPQVGRDIYVSSFLEKEPENFLETLQEQDTNTLILVGNHNFVRDFPGLVREKVFGEQLKKDSYGQIVLDLPYGYCQGVYFDLAAKKYLPLPEGIKPTKVNSP